MPLKNIGEPEASAAIKLSLRRTLVLLEGLQQEEL
jgi:hypothetical protein